MTTASRSCKDFTANLTGTIVPLPAGGLDFAVGVEHRKQSGFYEPDAIYLAGESAGVPSGPAEGEFDVDEVYGEMRVPILKDAPLADLLQLSAADSLVRLLDVRQRHDHQVRPQLASDERPAGARHVRRRLPRAGHRRAVRHVLAFRRDARRSVLGLHGGESGRAHGPAAGGGAGELPGARRAGELHADQPADFCHHRRQRGAGARGVGRLHGGPGLEPGALRLVRRGRKRSSSSSPTTTSRSTTRSRRAMPRQSSTVARRRSTACCAKALRARRQRHHRRVRTIR